MADMFLKFTTDVPGEAKADGHAGEIEVMSFSWGVSQPGAGSATGLGAAKASFADLNVSVQMSKASPLLMQSCAVGKHFDTAVLTCRRAGGVQNDYLVITLNEVFISSYNTSGSEGSLPMESLSLMYKQVKQEYYPQKDDGEKDTVVSGTFNLETVKIA